MLRLLLASQIYRLSSQTPPKKQRLSKPQRDTRPERTPEVFSVKFKQKLNHPQPHRTHTHTHSLPSSQYKL